ncbi:Uncharacterized membrane protein HdeD, DUF308 family [Blastococcus aggregatus]|uniref:Uncharacterized membrane protein HdeD, DUF308 family n=1 Tax=Blastococcus aggregatus TaxID=38502 RepID=A0A285VJH2_9ACTN|nr:HdeD family acid-resistance protein [Blastococcus aggregatus]SOC53698.1 Uncharacterized membrane protein HdeD, DUF308 family [Blastococcus aggregatus]
MAGQISLPTRGSGITWKAWRSVTGGADAGGHGRRRTRLIAGRRLSTTLALRGLLALLFGVLVLVWPPVTMLALALMFGAYALLDGAGLVGSALTTHDRDHWRPRWGHLLAGVASLLAGLMSLLWPQITGLALVMLAGAWAIITGLLLVTATVTSVLEVPSAYRPGRSRSGEWLLALAGITSLVLGIVVLLRPDVGAVAVATVLGIYALIAGVVLLTAAWCLRP